MEIHFRSYFHFKWFSEREREREEEEGAQITPLMSPVNLELQSDDRTHQIAPVSSIAKPRQSHRAARSHEIQSDDRMHQIAPVLSIAAPRRSHRATRSRLRPTNVRPTDLSLCVILIFVVVVVVW